MVLGHAWHRVSEVVEEIPNDEALFKDNLILLSSILRAEPPPFEPRITAADPHVEDLRVGVATPPSRDECLRLARVARLLAQLADAEREAAFGAERHGRVNLRGLRPHIVWREAAKQLHEC